MTRKLASAIVLTVKGVMFLTLALVDWLTAKANVSERGYLSPFRVARAFHAAVVAAWHGQSRLPSLLACTCWNHNACGPCVRSGKANMPDRLCLSSRPEAFRILNA